MDEASAAHLTALKRRIYLWATGLIVPVLPLIGFLQRDAEVATGLVYGTLTVSILGVFLALLTRRLSVWAAERVVLAVVSAVLLGRALAAVHLVDMPLDDLRHLLTETVGPSLMAMVLVLFLAADDNRQGLAWSLGLVAIYAATVAPVAVAALGSEPGFAVALLRQVTAVVVVTWLAYGLASLKAQLADVRARARALDELANTDSLTGIRNRRGTEEVLAAQFARVHRYGGELSIALLDLDRFKECNDHHGHAAGDDALRQVVDVLLADLRITDTLGRWGGDELLVVAPETDSAEIVAIAERWRQRVHDLGVPAGAGRITTSIGIASTALGDDVDTLLTRADGALYRAKRAGGDQVATATRRQPDLTLDGGLPVG